MKISQNRIVLIACLIIIAANAFWFFSGKALLQTDAPLRLVFGSLIVFILPGLLWGEVLGFRSRHFLETIAVSFALTVIIGIVFLPLPFLFHTTIRLWVALLLGACLAGAVILMLREIRGNSDSGFISPLIGSFAGYPNAVSSGLMAFMLALATYGVYQWGENIADIDGEKLIHLTYLRYYFEMPMALRDLSITRGTPPQNLVHLWEYMLAGWASLVKVDPLPLFFRSRFVIPVLGFSGLYLLIANIFEKEEKAKSIFWAMLIMCFGWFALLSPSGLDWIKQDPYRGLMSFMGSAHHADTAMEILIPLNAALALLAFRKPEWRSLLLLAGMLSASFMWHIREFFQTAVYAGIFGLTILLAPGIDRKAAFKKWAMVLAVFIAVAVVFGIAALLLPGQSTVSNEMKIKEIALSYGLQPGNIFGVRSLFNFPADLRLTQGLDVNAILTNEQVEAIFKNSRNYFLWLILSAFAVPLLTFFGSREDRRLSLFYTLLWFLVLCWNLSMLLLIVLTYSEINFTTPRMLYIFSFIMTANALYLAAGHFSKGKVDGKRVMVLFGLMPALGLVFMFWWSGGMPLAGTLGFILTAAVAFSAFFMVAPRPQELEAPAPARQWVYVLGVLLFFLPVLGRDYVNNLKNIVASKRQPVEWFAGGNPFGLTGEMIQTVRSLPQQKTLLVDPLGSAPLSIYAPQYIAVPPEIMGATLIGALDTYRDIRLGRHPLFRTDFGSVAVNPDLITKPPDFRTDFGAWKGADTVLNDIAKAASPMIIHGRNGDFAFRRIQDKGGNILHVSPASWDAKAQRVVQFGYALRDQGFNLNLRPGQEIVFSISARLSGGGPAQLIIIDRAETQEVAVENIKGSSWKSYVVRRAVRGNLNYLAFVFAWQPAGGNEWLEVKDIRIYVIDSLLKNYSSPVLTVDHKAVMEWLDKHAVDYILVEKKYYSNLLPYFQRFPKAYEIVFDNKENGELIVKYLLKPA